MLHTVWWIVSHVAKCSSLPQVIKLYAWEIPFQKQVMGIRQQELDVLKATAYLNAASSFTWTCAPFLVSIYTRTCTCSHTTIMY